MDRKRKVENQCSLSKCVRPKKTRSDSALSGVTYHNGYRGKICDIWHRKYDDQLFIDWLAEMKKSRSLLKGRESTGIKIAAPYVITHTCVVELIFKICKDLKQPADTRYRTVELFDRFIATQFGDLTGVFNTKQNPLSEWNNAMPRVSNQAILRILSCMQLASKYCAYCTIISPKVAHTYLTEHGQQYSTQSVLASEVRVFKTLNFDVGVPTLLVFVDVLLHLMREQIHDKIYTVCISIMDIIYLQRHHIFKRLSDKLIFNWKRSTPNKSPTFSSYEFDGLYCGAACIVSALKIYYPNNNDLLAELNSQLAEYVERPEKDITIFSNIILQTIGIQ